MSVSSSPQFPASASLDVSRRRLLPLLATGFFTWILISAGFLGLHWLLQDRPQFIGQPMNTPDTQLVQESPKVFLRRVSEDVASVKATQPASSEVFLEMNGRRDFRGLKTLVDMSGSFTGRHIITNHFEEPVFIFVRYPHPKGAQGQPLPARELQLTASQSGIAETGNQLWIWTGRLEPHTAVTVEARYQVALLRAATYHVPDSSGEPIPHLNIRFQRRDLPAMRFDTGEGRVTELDGVTVWERREFLAPITFTGTILESRGLHESLLQLLEIGPVISALFLLALGAVLLTSGPLQSLQVLTLSVGYALYFPLVVYLSSRFGFVLALGIAVLVPGVLLTNYVRLQFGAKMGCLGIPSVLLLYQVFPTLAAFGGWNRGMVLLCLGVVTFGVLIHLQNQTLKPASWTSASAMLCWAILGSPFPMQAATDAQVILPATVAVVAAPSSLSTRPPEIAFEPIQYQITQEPGFFRVRATAQFRVVRESDLAVPLLSRSIHLEAATLETLKPDVALLMTQSNRLALLARHSGGGTLTLSYRLPIRSQEGLSRVETPLLTVASGTLVVKSREGDLQALSGTLWERRVLEGQTEYVIGVAGEDSLTLEWGLGARLPPSSVNTAGLYGIGIHKAQHLTVIHSDGSYTHFSEIDLAAFQHGEFRLELPTGARLVSVSMDGEEVSSPILEDRVIRLNLTRKPSARESRTISLRLSYPRVSLAFLGTLELKLPEVFQTTGALSWAVLLPHGFESQLISSGLEIQKSAPDLSRFGDYGRLLKSSHGLNLSKELAPPGAIQIQLRYRQLAVTAQ